MGGRILTISIDIDPLDGDAGLGLWPLSSHLTSHSLRFYVHSLEGHHEAILWSLHLHLFYVSGSGGASLEAEEFDYGVVITVFGAILDHSWAITISQYIHTFGITQSNFFFFFFFHFLVWSIHLHLPHLVPTRYNPRWFGPWRHSTVPHGRYYDLSLHVFGPHTLHSAARRIPWAPSSWFPCEYTLLPSLI